MRLRRITPKVTVLDLGESRILFYEEDALAVRVGGFIYTEKPVRTGSETKAIDWLAGEDKDGILLGCYPVARVSEQEFRFLLGSTLTKEGLPLTRLEQKDNA